LLYYGSLVVPAQSYVERPPVPALGDLVRAVWIHRIGAEPYLQRNLPTGGVELHCPIGSLPRLVGPLTGPSVEVLAPGITLVGVRFHPGVAAPMLGLPAAELVDLTLHLDRIWGARRRRSRRTAVRRRVARGCALRLAGRAGRSEGRRRGARPAGVGGGAPVDAMAGRRDRLAQCAPGDLGEP
jgi:hypothetical protein